MTDTRELLLEAIEANIKAANDANKPLFDRLAQLEAMVVPIVPTLCASCLRVLAPGIKCPVCHPPHVRFTHNDDDTIYHQATPNGMRFAFLVVSEFFDTPSPGVTETLQFICDKLNETEQAS